MEQKEEEMKKKTMDSSGCNFPRIKVTAHPSSSITLGFFVLVTYKSVMFGLPVAKPQLTTERDQNGDFIAVLPSGDMADVVVSALEMFPGQIVYAQPQ